MEIGVSVFFVISGFLLYRPFAVAHFRQELPGDSGPSLRPDDWVPHRSCLPLAGVHSDHLCPASPTPSAMAGVRSPSTWGSPRSTIPSRAQRHHPGLVVVHGDDLLSTAALRGLAWRSVRWPTRYDRAPRVPHRPRQRQLRAELLGLRPSSPSASGSGSGRSSTTAFTTIMPNWLPGYLDVFALGMLLAVLSAWLATTDQRPSLLWHPAVPHGKLGDGGGRGFIGASNLGLPLTPVTPSPLGLSAWLARPCTDCSPSSSCCSAVFGPQDRSLVRGLLRARPVALLGVVSFGIYLWHESWIELFLRWTKDPLGLAGSGPPEAGGSEVHAARIAERWAVAGIDVHLTTSRAPGAPATAETVIGPAAPPGKLPDLPRGSGGRPGSTTGSSSTAWSRSGTACPSSPPLWARHPCGLPPPRARRHVGPGPAWSGPIGKVVERRLAPPFSCGQPIVTLSESSRRTILETLALALSSVSVVPPGVDDLFVPAGTWTRPHSWSRSGDWCSTSASTGWSRSSSGSGGATQPVAVIAGEGSNGTGWRPCGGPRRPRVAPLPGRADDVALLDLYRRPGP